MTMMRIIIWRESFLISIVFIFGGRISISSTPYISPTILCWDISPQLSAHPYILRQTEVCTPHIVNNTIIKRKKMQHKPTNNSAFFTHALSTRSASRHLNYQPSPQHVPPLTPPQPREYIYFLINNKKNKKSTHTWPWSNDASMCRYRSNWGVARTGTVFYPSLRCAQHEIKKKAIYKKKIRLHIQKQIIKTKKTKWKQKTPQYNQTSENQRNYKMQWYMYYPPWRFDFERCGIVDGNDVIFKIISSSPHCLRRIKDCACKTSCQTNCKHR